MRGYGKTELQIVIASAVLGFVIGVPYGGSPLYGLIYGLIGAVALPVLVFGGIVLVAFIASRKK